MLSSQPHDASDNAADGGDKPTRFWGDVGSGTKRVGCAIVALIPICVVISLLMPAVSSRPATPRSQCRNNLHQIWVALSSYHTNYGCFPPAYLVDEHDNPIHSWRTLLLPYLEESRAYQHTDFSQSWDSLANSTVARHSLVQFCCPAAQKHISTTTNYLAVIGPHTAWRGSTPIRLDDIRDDKAATILLVEVANSDVQWFEPRDLHVSQMSPGINPNAGEGISSKHKRGAQALFADGSIRFLDDKLSPRTLRALLSIDGGERIRKDDF